MSIGWKMILYSVERALSIESVSLGEGGFVGAPGADPLIISRRENPVAHTRRDVESASSCKQLLQRCGI